METAWLCECVIFNGNQFPLHFESKTIFVVSTLYQILIFFFVFVKYCTVSFWQILKAPQDPYGCDQWWNMLIRMYIIKVTKILHDKLVDTKMPTHSIFFSAQEMTCIHHVTMKDFQPTSAGQIHSWLAASYSVFSANLKFKFQIKFIVYWRTHY